MKIVPYEGVMPVETTANSMFCNSLSLAAVQIGQMGETGYKGKETSGKAFR
jgi:hypothetical protein